MVAIIILPLFLIACSTAQKLDCASTDWFELGRRQGISGSPLNTNSDLSKSCTTGETTKEHQNQLENGYQSGLSEYCTDTNALNLGRTGVKYEGVCPAVTEDRFLTYYQRGLRMRDISESRRSLDVRISRIHEELIDPNTAFPKRVVLEGEKIELKKKTEELDKKVAEEESPNAQVK